MTSNSQLLTSDFLAFLLLAVLTLTFFWPVTFKLGWIPRGGGDLASFLWPTYSYAAQSLNTGRIPLWNPTLYSGMPFAADNQSGLFYPLNLITFFLTPSLPYAAMEWLVIFHIWLAGASMYFLMRVLLVSESFPDANPSSFALRSSPLSFIPSLFSAVAYMFSDVFVTHVGNLNIIAVAAWLPAIFAALHLALTRKRAGWAITSGVLLGVAALAGHAQMTLIIAGALGLYGLWNLTHQASRITYHGGNIISLLARDTWHMTLTFLIAFGISALSIIPAVELTQFTARAQLDYAAASEYSLPWGGLAGFFSPLLFGRGAAHFWGPWDRVELGYLGVLPLLFAGFAPVAERRSLTIFLLLLGALGLLVALGANTPLHRLLYLIIPGFAQLRVPARFILLTDFAIAALAGMGLDRIITAKDAKRAERRKWVWGGLLIVIATLTIGLSYRQGVRATGVAHPVNLYWGLGIMLVLLLVGLTLLRFRERLGQAMPTLALALLAADLIGQGAWVEVDRTNPTFGFQHPKAITFLQNQPGPTRIDNASAAWQPDAAARVGLEDIGGIFNPLGLATYQTYMDAVGARGTPLYNFLNAQFVVADKNHPPGDSTFAPIFDEDPVLDIYLNTNAMPRVSLIYSVTLAPNGEAAFSAIHAPNFDPRTSVVIEDEAMTAPIGEIEIPKGASNLYYLHYAPESFSVVAVTPAAAYLVFSEVWYPGWRAWVNGNEVSIFRANFAFRGVYLPAAGEHTVVMRFDPLSWKIGLSITLLTLVLLVVRGAYSVFRSRITDHASRTIAKHPRETPHVQT